MSYLLVIFLACSLISCGTTSRSKHSFQKQITEVKEQSEEDKYRLHRDIESLRQAVSDINQYRTENRNEVDSLRKEIIELRRSMVEERLALNKELDKMSSQTAQLSVLCRAMNDKVTGIEAILIDILMKFKDALDKAISALKEDGK